MMFDINREWAMPNKNTFEIKPIHKLIQRYNEDDIISIDPFANSNRIAKKCNDIDPQYKCESNLDALDFLKTFGNRSIELILFDPPYSPRQVSECYRKMGKSVNMQTTQSSFWSNLKNEIKRIITNNGICISFGWNSGGIGKTNGFEIIEILIVAHGGWHNDTICTVEKYVGIN